MPKGRIFITGFLVAALTIMPQVTCLSLGQTYDNSSLMQGGPGQEGSMPQSYYPYWHNYLDNMQREGGYYAVTGNYGGTPITSYYPSSSSSSAMSPEVTQQSNMYYNPADYYGAGQQQSYQAPQQAYQGVPQTYQVPQQAYQRPPAESSQRSSKKKKSTGQAVQQQQQYAPQQQAYPQQNYGYGQQQQGYGQYPQQQATEDGSSGFNADPSVQAAQQKAYERAVARQRAAELAAQQQAAMQELQQTQALYAAAQQKLKEQEAKQRQLQDEYHKKAVGEAYESLRTAQQRYYELMGVSGESGTGPARQAQSLQYPGQQPYQQQPMAAAQPQTVPAGAYPQGYQSAPPQQAYPQAADPGLTVTPPGSATPLRIQAQQEQQESGGFWSTLKEIFSPPTTAPIPNQRSMFDNKKSAMDD